MSAFLFRRLLQSLVLCFAVSVLVFVILRLAPGDPATLLVDPSFFTPQQFQELRASLGLEDTWAVQYVKTMGGLFGGQLRSFRSQQPTIAMVIEALPTTLKVMLGGVTLALLLGVPLGVVAAYRPRSLIDNLLSVSMAFALSVPAFVLAMVLIRVFAEQLRWLPASGIRPPGATSYSWLTALQYLVLPSIATAFPISPILARYTRDALREVLQEDYVRTATAKGLARQVVVWRHVLPNALVPLISVLGIIIPLLLGGSVIVESLFALPGLGRITVQAALQRDYPVVMTTTIFATMLIVLANLLTDISYYIVDPRMRVR